MLRFWVQSHTPHSTPWQRPLQDRAHLVQVLKPGWQVVPNHLHGFEGGLIEVGGLPIHHLDHHYAQ